MTKMKFATKSSRKSVCTFLLVGSALLTFDARADEATLTNRLQTLGLPLIETLTYDSDYTVFMSPAVPTDIRNAALRKLWSYPVFNETDGLASFAEDYRVIGDGQRLHAAVAGSSRKIIPTEHR